MITYLLETQCMLLSNFNKTSVDHSHCVLVNKGVCCTHCSRI